jgi:hypothetical protein
MLATEGWALNLPIQHGDTMNKARAPTAARSTCMRVCSLKLLVYAALSYWCMRPYATSACGLTLLVYAALRYKCMRP